MSIAELCDLMIDIQAKIREAARSPKANKKGPLVGGNPSLAKALFAPLWINPDAGAGRLSE